MASASTSPNTSPASSAAARTRKIAIALAFTGALPAPLPLSWLHKFYLGQYLWGVLYLILAPTLIPQVACCFEGIWYLTQSDERFCALFPNTLAIARAKNDCSKHDRSKPNLTDSKLSQDISQTAEAIRELEQLRQEGLITEYEFEQKRRKLLNQV